MISHAISEFFRISIFENVYQFLVGYEHFQKRAVIVFETSLMFHCRQSHTVFHEMQSRARY